MTEKRKDIVSIIILCLVAFVIRFLLMSKGPFYLDALELAINAEKTLDTLTLHYMHAPGHPLVVIIGSIFIFFMRLVGVFDPVFSVNFMSVVFGSLGIGSFYLLSRRILDFAGALFPTLILCFLPLHIYISTVAFNHSVAIFFNLSGIYLLFLYLENMKINRLILSSILFGLGAASRLTDSLVFISVIYLYLSFALNNSIISAKLTLLRLLIFLSSCFGVIAIFYIPAFFSGTFSEFKSFAAGLYYLNYSPKFILYSMREAMRILGGLVFLLLIPGITHFFVEKNRILFYFLSIWLMVLFFYYGGLSIAISRYLLFPLMPLLIMQGYFVSRILKLRRLRITLSLLILLFILVVDNFMIFYPVAIFRHKHNLQRDFAEFVEKNTNPESYIIAMDEGPFIEYYAKRKVLYKAIGTNKQDFDLFFAKLNRMLEKNMPIYIISSAIDGYDPKKYFSDTLSNSYNLQYVGEGLNQDWHKKELYKKSLFIEKLYKVEKKKT